MSFFIVFVSPITFMLIGCVDLSATKTCEEATGVTKNRLPDGIAGAGSQQHNSCLERFCDLFPGVSTEEHCVVAFIHN